MKKGFIQIPLLIGIIAVALISAVIVGDVVINNKKQAEQPKQEQIVSALPSPSPEISSSTGFALTQSNSSKPANLNTPIPSRAPTLTPTPTPLLTLTSSPSSVPIITPTQTPTPSPSSTPTYNPVGQQATMIIYEVTGMPGAPNNQTNVTNLTARKNFDIVTFAIKTFDAQGNQVNDPITVVTNDPDMPSTFTIKANQGFYVGKTFNNIVQDTGNQVACPSAEYCLPLTVGVFNFTFTQPNLNISKTIQLTVTNYTPPVPVVSEYSAYNLTSYSMSTLNDRLSRLGFIYGYTPIFNISVQDSSTESYIWTNLQYSISSSDFQLSDINLICGGIDNGVFYLNSNGDFPNGSQNEITLNSSISPYAYLSGCNARRIGFALKNIHSGSLVITVTSAKFMGQNSGIPYNATGLPITSANIVIQ